MTDPNRLSSNQVNPNMSFNCSPLSSSPMFTQLFLTLCKALGCVGHREPYLQYSPIAGADCMITVMPGLPPVGGVPNPSLSLSYHLCRLANPRAQFALSEAALHYITPSRSLTLHDRGCYAHTFHLPVRCCSLLHLSPTEIKRVFNVGV